MDYIKYFTILTLGYFASLTDTDMGCARDAVHFDYFSHNLPVFSRTFLTGGQTPLIHVISDSTVTFTDVHTQFTTFTCDEWFLSTDIITEFNVNNLILIISCSNSNASRINLIVTKYFYSSNPSVLSRPQLLIFLPEDILYSYMYYLKEYPHVFQSDRSIDYIAFYQAQLFTKQNCGDDRDPKLNISYISIRNPLNLQHIELSGFKTQYEETIHSNGFHSFHDVGLTVAITAYSPFTKITSYGNGSEAYDGFCIELLDVTAEKLKFKYNITVSGQFGSLVDGQWNGIVGMVHIGEADIALTGFTITSQRETVVDFTDPFFRDPTAIVIKAGTMGLLYQLSPLQLPVWGVACLSMLLVVILLSALIGPLSLLCKSRDEEVSPVSTVALFTIQSSLCQGVAWIPTGVPARIIAMALWATLLVISTTYQGNLMASLATQKPSLPFATLNEVADDTQYTLLIRPDSSQRTLFESSTDGLYAPVWQKIIRSPDPFVIKTKTAVEKVLNEPDRYIFLSDRTGLEREFLPHCDVSFLPETFFPSGFGMGLPEGSPWKPYFDKILLLCQAVLVTSSNDEGRLVKNLPENYSRVGGRWARGVTSNKDVLNVTHGLTINNVHIDLAQGVMTVTAWENLGWNDMNLVWKPRDWGGVEDVRIPINQLFTPDITVFNADKAPQAVATTPAVVRSDGSVLWVPPMKFYTTCFMPPKVAKGTEVTCNIKFGSWTYDGNKLDLRPSSNAAEIESVKTADGQWQIYAAPVRRHAEHYDCCPEAYIDLTYTIRLRKL